MTPARLRPLAEADLVEHTRHYADAAGRQVAERFFDAALGALAQIETMPGSGSLRIGAR